MLYRFGSAELPGTFKAGHSHTDLATFDEIYTTARRLEENCIVGQGRASRLAWEPVGECLSPIVRERKKPRNLTHDIRRNEKLGAVLLGDGFEGEP